MNSHNSTAADARKNRNDSPPAGRHGTIPCLGDFIWRRLPSGLIRAWDSWLQHAMAASRAHWRGRWLDLYRNRPIGRFVLMPGACDASTGIWGGRLMPSVDSVGRYFPLTIALPVGSRPGMMLTVFSAQSWYAALERIALATLNINALPDDLDRNLADNPFPALEPPPQRRDAQELAAWWRAGATDLPKTLVLATENSLADLFDAAAEDILTASAAGKSFWWVVPSEGGPGLLHCFAGLPPENHFAVMLEAHLPAKDGG